MGSAGEPPSSRRKSNIRPSGSEVLPEGEAVVLGRLWCRRSGRTGFRSQHCFWLNDLGHITYPLRLFSFSRVKDRDWTGGHGVSGVGRPGSAFAPDESLRLLRALEGSKTSGCHPLRKCRRGLKVMVACKPSRSSTLTQNWVWNSDVSVMTHGKTHACTRMRGGAVQGTLPPTSPLTCTLELVYGARGPRPQEAAEAFWLSTQVGSASGPGSLVGFEVKVRLPGSVLLSVGTPVRKQQGCWARSPPVIQAC